MSEFEYIVVGLGGIGSAALYAASCTGKRVLGIDRFPEAHAYGSSHGVTRIIRTAYFEHPNYVALAQDSISMWREIEAVSGRHLMKQCGLLQVGSASGSVIQGVRRSVDQHGLDVELLDTDESSRRFPGFKVRNDEIAIYEPTAGYLLVEDCIRTHLELATNKGGYVDCSATVESWDVLDDGRVCVTTDKETYLTKYLILAVGAWSLRFLAPLKLNMKIKRKPQFWFDLPLKNRQAFADAPCFLFDTDDGCYYGFPWIDDVGLKIAEHSGGHEITQPELIDREFAEHELARITRFLRERFPGLPFEFKHHSVCMYTMSPDEHFFIDRHPDFGQVVFAAGLSGHGFKFAPLLGTYLVSLCKGLKDSRMSFLSLQR